jgi:hypothetical protein
MRHPEGVKRPKDLVRWGAVPAVSRNGNPSSEPCDFALDCFAGVRAGPRPDCAYFNPRRSRMRS